MSFAKYSDIQFTNMEAMVSSSIEKFRVQNASSKEPNLLYKLMVSKVIAKLKAMLFDPDFVGGGGGHNHKKSAEGRPVESGARQSDASAAARTGHGEKSAPRDKSPVQSQLQTLLRKRIAAKTGRPTVGGETRPKVRKLSTKDELRPLDTPELPRAGGFTLLIPFRCLSNSR